MKWHFTGTGPACTKTLSKEVVQGETKPEKGQATQQPGVQSARLLFSVTFLPLPSAPQKPRKQPSPVTRVFFPCHQCTSLHFPVSCNTWWQIRNSGKAFLLLESQLLTLFYTVKNNTCFLIFVLLLKREGSGRSSPGNELSSAPSTGFFLTLLPFPLLFFFSLLPGEKEKQG